MSYARWLTLPLSALSVGAVAQSGMWEEPSVAPSHIVIANLVSQDLNFSLRPRDGTWSNYTIPALETYDYNCVDCKTDAFEFEIKTGDKTKNYFLPEKNRYVIKLNVEENVFDIYKAS